jgi:tRNA modification GTPase
MSLDRSGSRKIGEPRRNTIFALASGPGRGPISVIRVSGPDCAVALQAMTHAKPLAERVAAVREVRDPLTGELLDRAVVIRFFAPRSFSGEDMLEFHVTGGHAVITGVLKALGTLDGFRPAEPGEFTRRAFENGKLDLSQVEGLADLVDAETTIQRRQALRIAGGALRREAEEIRRMIINGMAIVEAKLDFSDIEDAYEPSLDEVHEIIAQSLERVRVALEKGHPLERLREGLNIIIAGPPNAGKSTLMNAIAKRDVSIVSAIPGTTRDLVEVRLDLNGYPVVLIDTAGVRKTDDPIETEGVKRALRRAESADLVLWLSETGAAPDAGWFANTKSFSIKTKCDGDGGQAFRSNAVSGDVLRISAVTGVGLQQLLDEIARFAAYHFANASSAVLATERHRSAFRDAEAALLCASVSVKIGLELVAEDLRLAARALDAVLGRMSVEDVLDQIFARLCVGK